MAEAEKACPHSSSVTAFTFRVETPWTPGPAPPAGGQAPISARPAASACSDRWWRSNSSVEKRPSRVLRHPQLELADPGDQGAAVVARAVAEPAGAALALGGAERVRHLGLRHLLQHRAHDLAPPVGVAFQQLLGGGDGKLSLGDGHGGAPRSWRRQTPPACHDRLPSGQFAEPPARYPPSCGPTRRPWPGTP